MKTKKFLLAAAAVWTLAAAAVWAADTRTAPMTANIIIDVSSDMAGAGQAPFDWLCGHVLGELLIPGDTVNVWLAGADTKALFQGTLKDEAARADLEKQIRGITVSGDRANFLSALTAAASAGGGAGSGMVYTLIVSGSANPAQSAETAEMLRYSRVEGFSGWRAITAALNAKSRVRAAASAYMAAVKR